MSRYRIVLFACITSMVMAFFNPSAQAQGQHYQTARAALMEGDKDKAKLEVRLALQEDSNDARAHFLLASLMAEQGDYDQAIVGFQRACALDPTNPEALYNLGTLLLWRKEAFAASNVLESALLIRPDHIPSYNNLAKAYFMAGLPELAVATYEEVLVRDPWNVIALKNLAVLAEGAGLKDAAADYKRRLQGAQASGHGGPPTEDAGEPIILLPTWPLVAKKLGPIPEPKAQPKPVPESKVQPDPDVEILRAYLRDLPHVAVERRGDRLTVVGWTVGPREKELLGRILVNRKDVLDLTTDDVGDPQRMLEVDAIIFIVIKVDQVSVGFNFLNLITTNLSYFTGRTNPVGATGLVPPGTSINPLTGVVTSTTAAATSLSSAGWLFFAAIDYNVNIANASYDTVAVLARPHLTATSGSTATFLAGGDIVFEVTGNIGGNIAPYPFGTTLKITPTLLRTLGEDGNPQVDIKVDLGRKSLVPLPLFQVANNSTLFDDTQVTSEAVIALNRTLILSGLSQREQHVNRTGVPVLMYIPILKYMFSNKTTSVSNNAVVILLTPRDPAYWGEKNRRELNDFVEERREFLRAKQGTAEDMKRFEERYPNWDQIPPNRFATHFFLMKTSELYRNVSGQDLKSDVFDIDIALLGAAPKKK